MQQTSNTTERLTAALFQKNKPSRMHRWRNRSYIIVWSAATSIVEIAFIGAINMFHWR